MALALKEFLEHQLAELPHDHPDRDFFKRTLEKASGRIKRSEIFAKQGNRPHGSGQKVADYFNELKAGPYFDPAKIREEVSTLGEARSYLTYGQSLLTDIEQNGNNALAHLAIAAMSRNHLIRKGVRGIAELRDALATCGDFLGPNATPRVLQALTRFDVQIQQSLTKR